MAMIWEKCFFVWQDKHFLISTQPFDLFSQKGKICQSCLKKISIWQNKSLFFFQLGTTDALQHCLYKDLSRNVHFLDKSLDNVGKCENWKLAGFETFWLGHGTEMKKWHFVLCGNHFRMMHLFWQAYIYMLASVAKPRKLCVKYISKAWPVKYTGEKRFAFIDPVRVAFHVK